MTSSSLVDRVNALWSGYQESGDLALLNEAAVLLRAALRDTKDTRERRSVMSNLAAVLQARFGALGDAEVLDESIDLLEEALASTEEADSIRGALVLNLAAGLQARYEITGDTDALLHCIKLLRLEVNRRPDPAAQAMLQSLLSAALLEVYLAGGDVQGLDEAVSAARIAVNLTPPEETQFLHRLTTLASALSARSEATQDIADLNSAIGTARRALDLAALTGTQTANLAANLGALLHSRYELTGSSTDLKEAIALFSDAVALNRRPSAPMLRNLGAAMLSRFERSGNVRDIDEAVTLHRRALDELPTGFGVLGDYLADLGRCLSNRYRVSHQASDILEAIAALEEAVRHTPPSHPRVADYLSALAEARFLRYGQEADDIAAVLAVNDWQRAASVVGAGTSVRLKAARSWATTAAQLINWTSAAEGYEAAIGLLPELLWRSIAQADRSSLHVNLADLPCDAAACMIQVGSPGRALELLELGRGVLWSWLLGLPTELDALGRVAPELASTLSQIRKEIDHTGVPLVHAIGGAKNLVDRRMALARQWDELVAQVRSLPGFEDFLRSPRAERLVAVSADGPVVVVNVSRLRCDALVLRPDGISVVPLPGLTHDEAVGRLNEFLSVVSKLAGPLAVSDSLYRERALTDLLAWLWRTTAKPILDHLRLVPGGPDPARRLPRIWLCPTGPLAVLPLHAASRIEANGSLHGLIDYAVPSYTATASRLADAQLGAVKVEPGGATDVGPLLVSLAATPGLPGLPTASREMEILSRSAKRLRPTIVSGGDATTAAVREMLTSRSWVHFSCHATAEVDEPWRSGIQLYDGRLTLTDLAAQELPALRTVVLSSCATSAAGKSIAAESVNLVAALQSVGAQEVIGALWSVRDESAALIADRLYQDPDDFPADATYRAARRLHEAVMELRRVNQHLPSVWACFVHYGR